VNAILYILILRGGEHQRLLPHEFLLWQSVCDPYRRWRQTGTWWRINDVLRTRSPLLAARTPNLTHH
jgi:transposase